MDSNDDVRAVASSQLAGYLERANSALLREELLIGLIRGWYEESDEFVGASPTNSLIHTRTHMGLIRGWYEESDGMPRFAHELAHTHTHTHTHINIHIHMCCTTPTNSLISLSLYVYTHTYTHTYTFTNIYVHTYMRCKKNYFNFVTKKYF